MTTLFGLCHTDDEATILTMRVLPTSQFETEERRKLLITIVPLLDSQPDTLQYILWYSTTISQLEKWVSTIFSHTATNKDTQLSFGRQNV